MQESAKESKTNKYSRLFIHCLCEFCVIFPAQTLFDQLESITNGLISMVVLNVWSQNRVSCAAMDVLDVKHMIIGGTRLLLETPIALKPDVFASLLKSVLFLVGGFEDDKSGARSGRGEDLLLLEESEEDGREFDSTYSRLAFAFVPTVDPAAAVPSASSFFVTSLAGFCSAHAGQYFAAIQNALDEREASLLQDLLMKSNLRLV
jgi:hypothetical protein